MWGLNRLLALCLFAMGILRVVVDSPWSATPPKNPVASTLLCTSAACAAEIHPKCASLWSWEKQVKQKHLEGELCRLSPVSTIATLTQGTCCCTCQLRHALCYKKALWTSALARFMATLPVVQSTACSPPCGMQMAFWTQHGSAAQTPNAVVATTTQCLYAWIPCLVPRPGSTWTEWPLATTAYLLSRQN